MAKRFSRPNRWLAGILALTILLLTLVIFLSPYGLKQRFPYKLVSHTITIDAPPEIIFGYLGHSPHAAEWSVYVHHISPLNADRFPDGSVGSRRRCFRRADETGTCWDEAITEVVPNEKRQLILYNLVGFPMSAENLATEQIYQRIPGNTCQLTFTVFFTKNSSWLDTLKMYLAAYVIEYLFEKNMQNIKSEIETS